MRIEQTPDGKLVVVDDKGRKTLYDALSAGGAVRSIQPEGYRQISNIYWDTITHKLHIVYKA